MSGGRADKLGNQYEGLWVAYQLLNLLAERVAAVQLEAVEEDERGVDVWVTRPDGVRDAQQCKRKNRTAGRWGIGELGRQGVLTHLADQLRRDAAARFTFVSAHPAPELRELCDAARAVGGDPEAYFRTTLAVKAHAGHLRQFCQFVGADPDTPAGRQLAYDLLRRTSAHVFEDSHEGRNGVTLYARCLVAGDPDAAVEVLANLAQERMGQALTVEQVRRVLSGRGLAPANLSGNRQVVAQVEQLRGEFRDSLRPSLIHAKLVPRPEAGAIFDLVAGPADRRLVLLHGRGGAGKSCVLLRLTELLAQADIPYLPLRLDRRTPQSSSRSYGLDGCGLPESPAVVLRSLNPGRRVVLILDQLDAVRWTSAHASAPWEACRQVMDDALALPDVAVVVACRTFDLRDDQQIRAWHQARRGQEVVVGDLPDDAVARVIDAAGGRDADFSLRQRDHLRSPLHLALWVQSVQSGGHAGEWATQADLLRLFWQSRFDAAVRMGVPAAEVRAAVDALVAEMDSRGELTAPARTLDPYPQAANALRSLHVVTDADRRVSFAHQSYFEYRLACRLLEDARCHGRRVVEWVQGTDQSLFRRDQLRLVLTLLRDDDPGEYVRTLRELLLASDHGTRFHLRQLALRVFGEAAKPTPVEHELACELAGDPAWRDHAFDQVLTRQPAWFDAACDRGLVGRWLASEDGRQVEIALLLCRVWSGQRGDRVAGLVAGYADRPDPWPRWVAGVLPFNPAEDSPELFRLRLALVRQGVLRPRHLMAAELVDRSPERLVDLLDAHLEWREAVPDEPADAPADERRFPYFLPAHEVEHLERSADAVPAAFWGRLMPRVVRACEATRRAEGRRSYGPYDPDDIWDPDRHFLHEPNVELLRFVARAGAWEVGCNPQGFVTRTAVWVRHPGLSVQRTIGLALADAGETAADVAVAWLCDDPPRLSLPDERGDRWGIATRIIARHAGVCSADAFARLETTILGYHEPEEIENVRWQMGSIRAGWPLGANDYGLSQHALLPCLPADRIGDAARSEMGVLERKFVQPAAEYHRNRSGRVQTIVGPFEGDRAARVSDRAWLRIIVGVTQAWGRGHREVDQDTVADTSAEGYARSLAEQARRDPARFARLALSIPLTAYPAYLSGILYAITTPAPSSDDCPGWAPATDEQVRAVVEHVGYQDEQRLAGGVVHLMRERPRSLTTPATLELLKRYATDHPQPEPGWTVTSDDPDYGQTAINGTRCTAVGAIGHLLFEEPCLWQDFEPVLRRAARDPHPAVRVAVAGACLPMLNANREVAVELFLLACDGPDGMLSSRQVISFIRYSLWSHHQALCPLLRRMAAAAVTAVATAGAAWLTVASLDGRVPPDEIDGLASGTPAQRAGVARAAAHNCNDPADAGRCAELLSRLIDDPEATVRSEAGEFLRREGVLRSEGGRRLAASYPDSRAFDQDPADLVEALRRHPDSLVPLAEVVERVCLRLAGDLTDPARRERLRSGFAYYRFVPLLLRLYEQAEQVGDRQLRSRCLDWWDRLLEARLGDATELIQNLDSGNACGTGVG